jgi:hypothetical protein
MPRRILRLRRLFAELDYAQRRTLELRTGVSFTGPRPVSGRAQAQIARLESAWGTPAHPDAPCGPEAERTAA